MSNSNRWVSRVNASSTVHVMWAGTGNLTMMANDGVESFSGEMGE